MAEATLVVAYRRNGEELKNCMFKQKSNRKTKKKRVRNNTQAESEHTNSKGRGE